MEQNVYKEKFVKKGVPVANFQYVLDQIKACHSSEYGWVVGEPVIESKNADGTIDFYVQLEKYPVEKVSGRSI